jgi:hypothetical protein
MESPLPLFFDSDAHSLYTYCVPSFSRGYGHRFDLSGYFPRAIKTICIACISVFLRPRRFRSCSWAHGGMRDFWLVWFGLSTK